MHFYGPDETGNTSPVGGFQMPEATVESYNKVRAAAGISRFVAVQSVAYGFDNSVMFDALTAYGDDARAVVVVPADVDVDAIRTFHRLGARGARAYMLEGAVLNWNDLPKLCETIEPFGWHLQIQIEGEMLPDLFSLLTSLACPIVIEHNGKFRSPPKIDDEGLVTLLKLLDTNRIWVKMSGPYEMSADGSSDYRDIVPLAQATVAHRPDRLVWATNYPHPGIARPPTERALLDLLSTWTRNDRTARDRILVGNPSQLYA